jgi:O-antigen/teichoic acid export membrane protein
VNLNQAAVTRIVTGTRRILERGVLDLSASMGLILALGFVQNVFLARILGPEGLGHMAVLNTTMHFAGLLATAGLTTSVLRYAAAQKLSAEAWAVFRSGAQLAAMISVAVTIAVIAFSYSPLWVFDPIAALWIPLASLTLPVKSIAGCALVYCQSQERIRAMAVLRFLDKILLVVCVIAGAWVDGFRGAVCGFVVGSLAGNGITLLYVATLAERPRVTSPVPRGELVRFGAWGVFNNFLVVILVTAEVLLISALTKDAAAVGIYSLASVFQQIVRVPMNAYLDTRFPEMTRVSVDLERLRSLRRRMRLHVMGLTIAAAVAVGVAAPWLIPAVFGEAFEASVLPLEILLLSQLFWSLGSAQGRSMYAAGWVEGNFWTSLFAAAVSIGLNFALIPRFGILGAAAANAATHALWAIVVTVLNRWHERSRSRNTER